MGLFCSKPTKNNGSLNEFFAAMEEVRLQEELRSTEAKRRALRQMELEIWQLQRELATESSKTCGKIFIKFVI